MGLFRLDDQSIDVMALAGHFSQQFHHGAVELEHVMLALRSSVHEHVDAFMGRHRVNPYDLAQDIKKFLPKRNIDHAHRGFGYGVERMLERATEEATNRGAGHVDPEHLLLGLLWNSSLIHPGARAHVPETYASLCSEISRRGSKPITTRHLR